MAAAGLALLLAGICFSAPAHGATIVAMDYAGGRVTVSSATTIGWAFTLAAPTLITNVGFFDGGADGLSDAHQTTIWSSAGAPLVTATVPAGTAAALGGPVEPFGQFRYVPITPLQLPAGSYVITAYLPSTSDSYISQASSITTASPVTYNGSRFAIGDTFPPNDFVNQPNGDFGPNFQFEGIPEPSSYVMLLAWAACSFGGRRLRGLRVGA